MSLGTFTLQIWLQLVGRLVDSIDQPTIWLVHGQLVIWLIGRPVGWFDRSVGQLVGRSVGRSVGWLGGWLLIRLSWWVACLV